MTNLIAGFSYIALMVVGPAAAPASDRDFRPATEQIRMVCDQHCDCWRTRYQERRPQLAGRDDLACSASPSGRVVGYYNGYYRTGPATGLDFDSRYPVREFAFPF
ncbi:hypothetical protein [Bradyrhizobium genosp. P]|uniref:hypothetical protein n=1 Tax=Bradyrhizobium genosp. P TaxID=83641 RepID=UPI003CEE7638